jgi:hypothetical protein
MDQWQKDRYSGTRGILEEKKNFGQALNNPDKMDK